MITVNENEGKFGSIAIPEVEYEYSSGNQSKSDKKRSYFYNFAEQKGVIFSAFSEEEGSAFAKSLRQS